MRGLVPLILAFAMGAFAESSVAAAKAAAKDVLSRTGPPGLSWSQSQLTDMNCDGLTDHLLIASDEEHFYVGVVIAPITERSKVSIVAFALQGISQASFCGPFESLTEESLATPEELKEMVGQVPEGHRHSPKCKGLRLFAGECDSFHLFWNHQRKQLDWWRL